MKAEFPCHREIPQNTTAEVYNWDKKLPFKDFGIFAKLSSKETKTVHSAPSRYFSITYFFRQLFFP